MIDLENGCKRDDLYADALRIVKEDGPRILKLQRKLRIGFFRAASLLKAIQESEKDLRGAP